MGNTCMKEAMDANAGPEEPSQRANHSSDNTTHVEQHNERPAGNESENNGGGAMGSLMAQASAMASQAMSGGGDTSSKDVELVENAQPVTPVDRDARRRALFVGINYFGTSAELNGCINDVHNISEWLFTQGFSREESLILTDDQQDPSKQPTRENITNGMKWLVEGAQAGDSLFFEYSGHGGTAKDTDGDEQDSQDETICPVDYQQNGQILDDEMNQIMVHNLPKGVHLTCIYDSCHSGSALDLPFTYTIDGNLEIHVRDNFKAILNAAMKAGVAWAKGDKATAMREVMNGVNLLKGSSVSDMLSGNSSGPSPEEIKELREKMIAEKGTEAYVVQLAGCRDEQTSADAHIEGSHQGAMSYAFMETMKSNPSLTYTDLLKGIRTTLGGKYTQIPQMSTGAITDMNCPFTI